MIIPNQVLRFFILHDDQNLKLHQIQFRSLCFTRYGSEVSNINYQIRTNINWLNYFMIKTHIHYHIGFMSVFDRTTWFSSMDNQHIDASPDTVPKLMLHQIRFQSICFTRYGSKASKVDHHEQIQVQQII
jgi:hypothetical protein